MNYYLHYYITRIGKYACAIGEIRGIIHSDNEAEVIRRRVQRVLDQLEKELDETKKECQNSTD